MAGVLPVFLAVLPFKAGRRWPFLETEEIVMPQRTYFPTLILACLICSLPGSALAQYGGIMGGLAGGKSVGGTGTVRGGN